MEATVRSQTDGSVLCRVVLRDTPQSPSLCCSHAQKGTGFSCVHGIAVLSEKFGVNNLHKFVAERHFTKTWRKEYENCTFQLPRQARVDEVIRSAKKLVGSGKNVHVPKATPTPRGRPAKNAGKRQKGWYEKGPETRKKLSYSCSLCRLEDYLSTGCQLRQLFDDESA